jgi:hypothetical protein
LSQPNHFDSFVGGCAYRIPAASGGHLSGINGKVTQVFLARGIFLSTPS